MSTLVLIHGGLHGAWCWEPMMAPLSAAGHDVLAVEMPGRGGVDTGGLVFDDYVDAVDAIVAQAAEPVVLVAHSLGAVAASQFVERSPAAVSKLILVNALLVEDGEAALPKLQSAGDECVLLRPGALVFSDDGIATARREDAIDAFYSRCAPADAAWAADRLCAEPIGPLMTPMTITQAGFGSVPKTYLGSRHDCVLPWAFQQTMAQASGSAFVCLEGDHSPWLSVPEEFLRFIMTCIGPDQ